MPRPSKAELAAIAKAIEERIDAAESALSDAHDALGELMERLGLIDESGRLPAERKDG